LGEPVADGFFVWGYFGSFGKNNTVQIGDPQPGLLDSGVGLLQHFSRVAAPVGGIGVGEHLADVSQRRRAQQGIGNRVKQDIRVTVSDGMPVVRDLDTADP
jgi:hypothetical protein